MSETKMAHSSVQDQLFSPRDKFSQMFKDAVKVLSREPVIALDSEGVNLGKDGPLTLLQLGTLSGTVYLFDVMLDEMNQDKRYFKDTGLDRILTSKHIVKVIQSCSNDSAALYNQFGIRLENVFDTQVAHLVIEEHKGRLLPIRLKLADICQKYSEKASVYEAKDDVKEKWSKREGNFWAKRPMTDEMIEYASGDVTALIPEVYENQKRYLETNNLLDLFYDRVKEEVDYYNDFAAKEQRVKRQKERRNEILNRMATKYRRGSDFDAITDDDEKRALENTKLNEIKDFPQVVVDMKYEEIRQYLQQVADDLTEPERYNPPRDIIFRLNDLEHCDDCSLKSRVSGLKKQVIQMVTGDIELKYDSNTSVETLYETELQILRLLKPLAKDEPAYGPIVRRLYWDISYRDIAENIKKLKDDPDVEVHYPVSKLMFYIRNTEVPRNVKETAKVLLEAMDSFIVGSVERKYTRNTSVSEITDAEKAVLSKLRIPSKPYGKIVTSLYWKVTFQNLCNEIQDFRSGKLQASEGLIGRIGFLAKNDRVPYDVKEKANEFLKLLPRRSNRRR